MPTPIIIAIIMSIASITTAIIILLYNSYKNTENHRYYYSKHDDNTEMKEIDTGGTYDHIESEDTLEKEL